MKLLFVPPYSGAGYDFKPQREPYYHKAIEALRAFGQLDGIDVDIDEGAHIDHVSPTRDETTFDLIALNTQQRVKSIVAAGGYDAIVVLGTIDVAFHSIRAISPIPVAFPWHSALHVASSLADRFSLIDVTDTLAVRQRRLAKSYGFDDKLASIRTIGRSSADLSTMLREPFDADGRLNPDASGIVDALIGQCRVAIETDRAELLIIGFAPLHQIYAQIREHLDAAGFAEIPLVSGLAAAVATAKSMVEMRLMPAARAYPTDALLNVPALR